METKIYVDQEICETIAQSLKELNPRAGIPRTEFLKIAREMIESGKIDDGDWALSRIRESRDDFRRRRNFAKLKGYAPFTCLSKRMYEKVRHTFGDEMIEILKTYLEDPEDIHIRWGYRFAYTLNKIGHTECLAHADYLHKFVTTHALWEELKEEIFQAYQEWVTQDPPGWVRREPVAKDPVASSEQE